MANRIVAEGIKFIDGHACSGSSIPASAVYAEARRADDEPGLIQPGADRRRRGKSGWPTIMRLYTRDDAQGAFIGPWIAEKYKGKNVVILHDKSAYGQGVADAVKATMNAGGLNEVMYEGINAGDKDYSALVTKMKELKADVVYFGGYHPEAGLILRQSAEQGFKFQLIMPDIDRLARILAGRRPGRRGHDVRLPVGPAGETRSQGSGREDQGGGFVPEGFTLFSYAVIQAFAQGIERAGSDDPAEVATALKNGDADQYGGRPDHLRREGRHQERDLRHQPVARRQIRADPAVRSVPSELRKAGFARPFRVMQAASSNVTRTVPSVICAPSAAISATTPSWGAAIVCSIFIASRISSGWPLATASPLAARTILTSPGIGARMLPAPASASAALANGSGTAKSNAAPSEKTVTWPGQRAVRTACVVSKLTCRFALAFSRTVLRPSGRADTMATISPSCRTAG